MAKDNKKTKLELRLFIIQLKQDNPNLTIQKIKEKLLEHNPEWTCSGSTIQETLKYSGWWIARPADMTYREYQYAINNGIDPNKVDCSKHKTQVKEVQAQIAEKQQELALLTRQVEFANQQIKSANQQLNFLNTEIYNAQNHYDRLCHNIQLLAQFQPASNMPIGIGQTLPVPNHAQMFGNTSVAMPITTPHNQQSEIAQLTQMVQNLQTVVASVVGANGNNGNVGNVQNFAGQPNTPNIYNQMGNAPTQANQTPQPTPMPAQTPQTLQSVSVPTPSTPADLVRDYDTPQVIPSTATHSLTAPPKIVHSDLQDDYNHNMFEPEPTPQSLSACAVRTIEVETEMPDTENRKVFNWTAQKDRQPALTRKK